jgi:UDP-N-acetylmuramoyl-tripeptide--D-alanyl-D-alanine ligase
VVTSVAEAHLEGLGTLDDVAKEKLSLLDALPQGGLAVVPWDNPSVRKFLPRELPARLVRFGTSDEAELRATHVEPMPGGVRFVVNDRFAFELPALGRHNAMNALAAVAVTRGMGLEHEAIAERMRSYQPPPMRLQVTTTDRVTVINDAYNANPASVLAALEVLGEQPGDGRRIAVLGDMLELGEASRYHHQQIGRAVGQGGYDLVAVGEHAEVMSRAASAAGLGRPRTFAYADAGAAADALDEWLRLPAVVLLKASRLVGLESLVATIAAADGQVCGGPSGP